MAAESRSDVTGPVVCVDLNGVLDCYSGWQGADHWDPPAPGARAFLETLHRRGYRIIIFTTRHHVGVEAWLAAHDLAQYVSEVTDRKPPADVFVDDRAVCFQGDFEQTLRDILAFTAHWERHIRTSPQERGDVRDRREKKI